MARKNLEKCKEYEERRPDRKEQKLKYYQEHSEQAIAYSIKYAKNKRKTDSLFKLKDQIRADIRNAFRRKGFGKCSIS